MTTIFETLVSLQPSVYEGNKSRGFWEKGQDENRGERAMLIITELAEAVEAHRHNHWFKDLDKEFILPLTEYFNGDRKVDVIGTDTAHFTQQFEDHCKNSVEDEIADTVIRILDYTGGYGLEIEYHYSSAKSHLNFAEDVLRIVDLVVLMQNRHNAVCTWGHVLSKILHFCEWYNIDLIQHVNWKLRYNATREYKHGKAY